MLGHVYAVNSKVAASLSLTMDIDSSEKQVESVQAIRIEDDRGDIVCVLYGTTEELTKLVGDLRSVVFKLSKLKEFHENDPKAAVVQ